MGCVAKRPEGSAVLIVEFKINRLAPAVVKRVIARGRAVRVGRTVGVATAEVFACAADGAESVIALLQMTMMRVEPRGGAAG